MRESPESDGEEEPLTADAFRTVKASTRRIETHNVVPVVSAPAPEAPTAEEAGLPNRPELPDSYPLAAPAPFPQPGPAWAGPGRETGPDPAARLDLPAPPAPGPSAAFRPHQPYPPVPDGHGQHAYAAPEPPAAGYRMPAPDGPSPSAPPLSYGEFQSAAEAKAPSSPAQWGWRGRVRRMSGGLISPGMSRAEMQHRAAVERVQTTFTAPRTVVFVNPKGGAGTTTSTLLAGRTFGTYRGGGVVAWDNNETRGTLGQRARPAGHVNTARELLDNIGLFENEASARIGDLGLYLRGQGGAHFDVLASDERAEVTGHIDAREVGQLHALFSRFYRLILIDTGNNMRAPNWLAAVGAADLLVVTATVRQDTAAAALWMLDALEKDVYGPGRLKDRCVTLLAEPAPDCDLRLRAMMHNTFGARTRAVMPIPYDKALVDGGVVNYDRLSSATHSAWLHACAAIAEGLDTAPTTH